MKKIFYSLMIFCFSGLFSTALAQPFDVVWTDLVGTTANGNDITNTASTSGWGNSGAASENTISGDGWMQCNPGSTGIRAFFGLSAVNNDANFNTINYGLHFTTSNSVSVYENGTAIGTFETYTAADVFKIEKVGNTVTYLKNNVIFYTSTVASNTDLICDVAFFNIGNSLLNATSSAPSTSNPPSTGGGFFVNDDDANDTDIRYSDGKVTIGPDDTDKTSADYNLFVSTGIMTEKVKVAVRNSSDWADYVFEEDYQLTPISDVELSIKENKHLPNVPSAKSVVENGINVAEMDATLLRQIEELWLHMIELKKENAALKAKVEALSK